MRKLLAEVAIPQHITHVLLSNKRRAKYYKKGEVIPKKYQQLQFNNKGILVGTDNKPIIKNKNTVGKPRIKKINGQDFYAAFGAPQVRAKIIREMKEFFEQNLNHLPKIPDDKYPIEMEIQIQDAPIEGFDVDNHGWIYTKVIQDSLKAVGIIPDDNYRYIYKTGACEFVPIESTEKRKLTVKLYSKHDN